MSEGIDFDSIKATVDLAEVVSRYGVDLKRTGSTQQVGCCPFHHEKTPSFTVYDDGHYHCYGCDAHGDVIDFVMQNESCSHSEAAGMLLPKNGTPTPKRVTPPEKKGKFGIMRIPSEKLFTRNVEVEYWSHSAGKDRTGGFVKRSFDEVYDYDQYGLVCRTNATGTSKKRITPLVWVSNEFGDYHWMTGMPPAPRPLFRLAEADRNPDKPILIVEGEKTAVAASFLVREYVAMTNMGGSSGVAKTDWSPLKGRKVYLAPDNDEAGEKWLTAVTRLVEDAGARVAGVFDPSRVHGLPKGWDLADFVGNEQQFLSWAKQVDLVRRSGAVEAKDSPEQPKEKEEEEHQVEPSHAEPAEPPPPLEEITGNWISRAPFTLLGWEDEHHYVLPHSGHRVLRGTANQFANSAWLANIAPRSFWYEANKYVSSKTEDGKVAWGALGASLICASNEIGAYDPDLLRGVGVWRDDGRIVVNEGTRLVVDGKPVGLHQFESNYAYQQERNLHIPISESATSSEARALFELCRDLGWQHTMSGYLLAGWCVVAPVCGILSWRPHIWLSGLPGTGKSTVLDRLLKPVIGPVGMEFAGNSTEAGIRRAVKRGARPVIMDEAEAEGKKGKEKMQAILNLIRMSSSGGSVTMANATGTVDTFVIRSAFCLSSINVTAIEEADKQRISLLLLRRNEDPGADEWYKEWERKVDQVITPEFSAAMAGRTLKHIDTLLHNIKSFEAAGVKVFGSKRLADQQAPMIAGAFLCVSDDKVSPEYAETWMRKQDWSEHVASRNEEHDKLLNAICTHVPRDQEHSHTIGDLINAAAARLISPYAEQDGEHTIMEKIKAPGILANYGIKVVRDVAGLPPGEIFVAFSNKTVHRMSKEILANTNWADIRAVLSSHPDKQRPGKMSFGVPGLRNERSTAIPLDYFMDSR